MELDPLTIALEILNFLVLLWILQRFMYKPIKAAIAQRQQVLEQGLKDAQTREQAAAALLREHQHNLEQWQVEKTQQQSALQQALAKERDIAMAKIREAAETERRRLQVLQEQDCAQMELQVRKQATQSALQLTGRMLQRVASEALDQLLVRMLLEDLAQLSDLERKPLQDSLRQQQGIVIVTSAHPLSDELVNTLQQTFTRVLEQSVSIESELNPDLISGVRINIGAQVLHANLAEELAFFGRNLNHDVK